MANRDELGTVVERERNHPVHSKRPRLKLRLGSLNSVAKHADCNIVVTYVWMYALLLFYTLRSISRRKAPRIPVATHFYCCRISSLQFITERLPIPERSEIRMLTKNGEASTSRLEYFQNI